MDLEGSRNAEQFVVLRSTQPGLIHAFPGLLAQAANFNPGGCQPAARSMPVKMRLIYQKETAMREIPPSERKASTSQEGVTVRTYLKPGDIGAIVSLHGILYAGEYGFDPTFEAYVAGPLAEFVRSA